MPKKSVWGVMLLFTAVMLLACGGAWAAPGGKPAVDKFAVMPFVIAQPDTPETPTATCAITGGCFDAGQVPPEAAAQMNEMLATRLRKITSVPFVPAEQTALVARDMIGRDVWLAGREQLAALGRKLGVQLVLAGSIYRWRERVGSDLSADVPAAVTFELALVQSSDGSLVWSSSFDEAQKPLTDNWLNLGEYMRHGIKWFTVQQFAQIGLDQVLKNFPLRDKPAE